jgi:AraC-like DNA-binding protein
MPNLHLLAAHIPATYGLALLNLLLERGHTEEAALAGTQLTRALLQDQRGQIAAWQYAALLSGAVKLDGDPGLAYELGLRSQVTKHGFVGFGLISCATLREAIEFSQRYFQARVPIFDSHLTVHGDQVAIELRELVPMGPLRQVVIDIAVVELCSLFAKVLGQEPGRHGWASEIWVTYAEPPAYARYTGRIPPFKFNQASTQIRFPARMLDEPIATADPVSVQLAIERCEQELASQVRSLTTGSQVSAKLVCRDGHYPDIQAMAQQMLMSERTLKRRLQDEGTSFQALLDQVRHRDSLRLLAQPQLAIKQVAEAVGYADPANFARAFGKWTGMSPRAWRQRHALPTDPPG